MTVKHTFILKTFQFIRRIHSYILISQWLLGHSTHITTTSIFFTLSCWSKKPSPTTDFYALFHRQPIWLNHAGHSLWICREMIWCGQIPLYPSGLLSPARGLTFPGCSSIKGSVCWLKCWKMQANIDRGTKTTEICKWRYSICRICHFYICKTLKCKLCKEYRDMLVHLLMLDFISFGSDCWWD